MTETISLALWILIAAQIAMGAFDTLYHHEFTERLAWRQSQGGELKLHAARNLFYAGIFTGLALFQPGGIWAYVLIIALSLEFIITLRDFVEEDLTRKLPVSERLLHTVITANYGAVLALLLPLLWSYGKAPTGLIPIWYEWWSLMLLTGALGVIILGARDLHASYRLPKLQKRAVDHLIESPAPPKTYLITGGTGFIGQRLIPVLQKAGHNIIVLTRNAQAAKLPAPIKLVTDLNQIPSDTQIDVLVNLAGEPLAKGFWTHAKKAEFRRSRLNITAELNTLVNRLKRKPEVLINGSAIGIYGVKPQGIVSEEGLIENDDSFSQQLCLDWEAATQPIAAQGVRTICLRIGMVLDREGGALAQLLVPTELGGGAVFGNGEIMVSWISRDDLVRLIQFAAHNTNIQGALNAVSPNAVNNKRFIREIAKALYRPTLVTIPKVLIGLLGGLGKEILLADQNIKPKKALENGFTFLDEEVEPTVEFLLRPQQKQGVGTRADLLAIP
jgi:uncharacterized protein (TIGR01777 family)